jgi:hypothetical protein
MLVAAVLKSDEDPLGTPVSRITLSALSSPQEAVVFLASWWVKVA